MPMAARPVEGVGAPKTIQRPAKSSANERLSSRASGQPEAPGEPTLPARAIGVGFAFLLAVQQCLSRLALLSLATSVARQKK